MISVAVAWSISIPVLAIERMRVAFGLNGSSTTSMLRSNAVAVIVSEETGVISAAIGGEIIRNLDASSLRNVLQAAVARKRAPAAEGVGRRQEAV